jgi:hypothetical protein
VRPNTFWIGVSFVQILMRQLEKIAENFQFAGFRQKAAELDQVFAGFRIKVAGFRQNIAESSGSST